MYWEQHFSALCMAFFYEDLREHLYVNTGVFDVEISNVIFDLPEEIPNLLIYDVYLVRYFLELQTRSYKVADRHSLHPLCWFSVKWRVALPVSEYTGFFDGPVLSTPPNAVAAA